MPEHKTLSPTLKPTEFKRDSMGRFERPGATLKKDQKSIRGRFQKGQAPGPGRPKGSQNKTTLQLKEAVLSALAKLGGDDYLVALRRENSSAFASLLAKVLPTQLAADNSDGGVGVEVRFVREIVYPSGQRHIEGTTPKSLPAPDASNALPRPTDPADDTKGAA
jgi:hypothetical protein